MFKVCDEPGGDGEAALLPTGGLHILRGRSGHCTGQVPEATFQVGKLDVHGHAIELCQLHLEPLGDIAIGDDHRSGESERERFRCELRGKPAEQRIE